MGMPAKDGSGHCKPVQLDKPQPHRVPTSASGLSWNRRFTRTFCRDARTSDYGTRTPVGPSFASRTSAMPRR
jgi:hypothetical protein